MAEALAKQIRQSADSDDYDMSGFGLAQARFFLVTFRLLVVVRKGCLEGRGLTLPNSETQIKDLVQLAFVEPIQVAEMVSA